MKTEIKKEFKTLFDKYRKKYFVSKSIYLGVNLMIMITTVILTVLNVRAIQSNSDNPLRWIFLSISLINIVIAFISSLNTLFAFNNFVEKSQNRINEIEEIQKNKDNYDTEKIVDILANIDNDYV